jgi:hypothetical protein
MMGVEFVLIDDRCEPNRSINAQVSWGRNLFHLSTPSTQGSQPHRLVDYRHERGPKSEVRYPVVMPKRPQNGVRAQAVVGSIVPKLQHNGISLSGPLFILFGPSGLARSD